MIDIGGRIMSGRSVDAPWKQPEVECLVICFGKEQAREWTDMYCCNKEAVYGWIREMGRVKKRRMVRKKKGE